MGTPMSLMRTIIYALDHGGIMVERQAQKSEFTWMTVAKNTFPNVALAVKCFPKFWKSKNVFITEL